MTENIYESPSSKLTDDSVQTSSLSKQEILFSFQGRIPRQTYWFALLSVFLVYFLVLFSLAFLNLDEGSLSIIILIIYIPTLWISLAVQVKRWHDRNKSGWWVLITLIPLVGAIWVFIENGCLPGDEGENRYGFPSA